MSCKKFLLFSVLMLAFCASVKATTVTLTAKDHGVLGAMHDAKCYDAKWLGRVMMDSHILPSQLNSLPEGTPILVPDECQNGPPTHEDVKITQQVISDESLLQRLQDMEIKLAAMSDSFQQTVGELAQANLTIDGLRIQIAALQAKLALPSTDQEVWKQKWFIPLVIVSVVSLSIVAWLLFPKRRESRPQPLENISGVVEESSDLTRCPPADMEFHGVGDHFFDNTRHTVGCRLCGKTIINTSEDKMAHLTNVHPRLRLHKISPEDAEQLLSV